MRLPDPTSESAKERLDNVNPKLHGTVDNREITKFWLKFNFER